MWPTHRSRSPEVVRRSGLELPRRSPVLRVKDGCRRGRGEGFRSGRSDGFLLSSRRVHLRKRSCCTGDERVGKVRGKVLSNLPSNVRTAVSPLCSFHHYIAPRVVHRVPIHSKDAPKVVSFFLLGVFRLPRC